MTFNVLKLTLLIPFATAQVSYFPGYNLIDGFRCNDGGQPIGDKLNNLKLCINVCNSDQRCVGVNWVAVTNECIPRSVGCQIGPTIGSFYEKTEQHENYHLVLEPQQRCSAGSTIGAVSVDFTQCRRLCFGNDFCQGINFVPLTSECLLKGPGCLLVNDSHAQYLKKIQIHEIETTTVRMVETDGFFSLLEGKRCSGGIRASEILSNLEQCKQACLDNPLCTGVNFVPFSNNCVARSNCQLSVDPNTQFYERVDQANHQTDQEPTLSSPTPLRLSFSTVVHSELIPPGASAGQFMEITRRRCQGGHRITSLRVLDECKRVCLDDTSCTGVNYVLSNGECVVRSECTLVDDENINFFQRTKDFHIIKGDTIRPPIPTYATVEYSERSFQVVVGHRCVGGYESITNLNLGSCIAMCRQQPNYCIGLNYRPSDGSCTSVTGECSVMPNVNYEFHRLYKIGFDSETTSNTPIITRRFDVTFPNYESLPTTRCVGDDSSKLGETQSDLSKCMEICASHFECFGINHIISRSICNVRTSACILTADSPGAEFLRKQV